MSPLTRVRFFDGQLLTAADFQAEQDPHREKARRHNRHIHGSGVVNGLSVSLDESGGAWSLTVAPGFAIDATGNEIEVCDVAIVPLPAGSGRLSVDLVYAETPSAEVPLANGSAATRVAESYEIVLTPVTPAPAVSNAGPAAFVTLARIIASKGGWRIDRRFRVQRTR